MQGKVLDKLLQDNDSAHNSKISKTLFIENGMYIMENWHNNYPDININENVWSHLRS